MVIRLGPGAEFDLIRTFLDARAAGSAGRPSGPDAVAGVRVGPGDDCAVVTGDGIAITVDMAVEDVHFRRDWLDPVDIGYHAAAGALSDLAAVAARPIGILASVALGPGDEREPGRAVMEGVTRAVESVGGALLGGDLTRSPGPLVVDIVAIGEAPEPVLRSGARPGDELWVTGRLGGAAAAVAAWLDGRSPDPAAVQAYARPVPRIREALWLAAAGIPTAMVDLSDGIAGDAGHIAAASGVFVIIEAAALPVAPAVRGPSQLELAAAGGEDYELCFSARPGVVAARQPEFEAAFGIPLTRVGRVEEAPRGVEGEREGTAGAVVVNERGEPLRVRGFQHWREG